LSSAWKYVIAYLVIIQLFLDLVVPASWVYHYRVPYEIFKDDPHVIDLALDRIAREIHRKQITDYVFLLGDSVMYSGPGGPDQSIGYYMEKISAARGRPLRVFNLAQPAMQAGDIYIVLHKLKERGLATDRVVINLLYGGFVARRPNPPIVYWLGDDLRRVDPEAWRRHREALLQVPEVRMAHTWRQRLDLFLRRHVSLMAYRATLRDRLFQWLQRSEEVYNTQPWHEKPWLPALMQEDQYQQYFRPHSFDMTASNPQIDFLQRILALTADRPPLIFLTPSNQVLMEANVAHPGYQANLRAVDAWFANKPAYYYNWESALPDGLFADHVHLTPEGYEVLAGMILDALRKVEARGSGRPGAPLLGPQADRRERPGATGCGA